MPTAQLLFNMSLHHVCERPSPVHTVPAQSTHRHRCRFLPFQQQALPAAVSQPFPHPFPAHLTHRYEADPTSVPAPTVADVLADPVASAILEAFRPFLESPSVPKIWHNYGFDRHVLSNMGVKLAGFAGDTMHMARWGEGQACVRGSCAAGRHV